MAVVLRLQRVGAKKVPVYRVVAADKRRSAKGKVLEILGHYDPRGESPKVAFREERVVHWLKNGARPSESLTTLLRTQGVLARARAK